MDSFVLKIKGYNGKELYNEVLRVSKVISLQDDLDTIAKKLSGGMKRRLSVGMSLTGGSKIVIKYF